MFRRPRLPRKRSRPFRRLFVEALEERLAPAIATFVNSAGGSWGVASNWKSGAVPVAGDDLVIPFSGCTVTESESSVSVASIQSQATLNITNGLFQVTSGSSSISASLTVAGGAFLTATGVGTSFTASGSTAVDGANLFARGGATPNLPGG